VKLASVRGGREAGRMFVGWVEGVAGEEEMVVLTVVERLPRMVAWLEQAELARMYPELLKLLRTSPSEAMK
jgi:hypothetical protein